MTFLWIEKLIVRSVGRSQWYLSKPLISNSLVCQYFQYFDLVLLSVVGLRAHIRIDPPGQHVFFTDCYEKATMQNRPSNARKLEKDIAVYAVGDCTILRCLITI